MSNWHVYLQVNTFLLCSFLYTYRFSVKITYNNSDMLLKDDVTNYFSTNKSCIYAVYCCYCWLRDGMRRVGHPMTTIYKDRGVVDVVPNHSQPGIRRRWVVSTTLCLLYPPRKDSVPIARHQYNAIAYVISHSSYRWQSRDLVCTTANTGFSLSA
jgi:hypothetical protein